MSLIFFVDLFSFGLLFPKGNVSTKDNWWLDGSRCD